MRPHHITRYLLYGDISAKAAAELRKPEVADHFARLIQRVAPKSYAQVWQLFCCCPKVRIYGASYVSYRLMPQPPIRVPA